MILADKIIEERKKLGWSQDELAEQLNVSRQSVSKWEGAQSIPDINRILQMAQLFGVSTDYLLKDDAVPESVQAATETISPSRSTVHQVSMEEASAYLALREKQAPVHALGVSLCVLSAAPLLFMTAASSLSIGRISDNAAAVVGTAVLLILVAIAVFTFIRLGKEANKYEYLEKVEIETAYGVDGMAKEKRAGFEGKYTRYVAFGAVLCILSSIPLILSTALTENEAVCTAMVGVLLVIVAIAVYLFAYAGMIKDSYDILLQEGDYTIGKKKIAPVIHRISGIYWLVAVAIYLAISLPNNSWGTSWVIWPVAGVLFPVVIGLVKIITRTEE